MHRYLGPSPDDVERVLAELGLDSLDDLFSSLPDEVKTDRLELSDGVDEHTMLNDLHTMANRNLWPSSRPCFLGAGVYRHVLPMVVDAVISRGEFLTSYTPYQSEITQGTLQAIFEFQTLFTQLTDLQVANASLYDGATAMVEAALMAHRKHRGKRSKVVVAESVHPHYRQVLDTYAGALDIEVVVVGLDASGRVDRDAAAAAVDAQACCLIVQSPNFLGVVEDLAALAELAKASKAMAVQVVTDTTSFGLLKGGGAFGFDIVCGEAQAFGVAPGFGGPHLGFFACRDADKRQAPGRLVGETVDADGRRAYCLTLSTREQHIRRAKATSNICTNQGLMALAATVWLELVGGFGLIELARDNHSRAAYLAANLPDGWQVAYPDSGYYHELLVTGPGTGEQLVSALAERGVLGGVAARRWGGSWPEGILVAVTECNKKSEIDALIAAMAEVNR